MAKMTKDEAVQWYAQNRGLYKKLSQKIHNIILELLEESNVPIHAITSRAKEIDSFKTKIENPKYDDPLHQITDFSGIRVIAYVEDDLKPICKIIEEAFDVDLHNSGDKAIELGIDKVGYKSIHYVAKIKSDRLNLPEYKKFKDFRFEIQIRTILQHAWAEIEHDRNYKFNGDLPVEISRRFKILAGTLELIDREFNQLSKDIDKISENVIIADKKNILDGIQINSTTLKSYLSNHFKELIDSNLISSTLEKEVTEEVRNFGIKTLDGLKAIIPKDLIKNLKAIITIEDGYNFMGLLRVIMIINNSEKYFKHSWKNHWNGVDSKFKSILGKYINVEKAFENIDIEH